MTFICCSFSTVKLYEHSAKLNTECVCVCVLCFGFRVSINFQPVTKQTPAVHNNNTINMLLLLVWPIPITAHPI